MGSPMLALLNELWTNARLSHPLPVRTEAGKYRETRHVEVMTRTVNEVDDRHVLQELDYPGRRNWYPAYRVVAWSVLQSLRDTRGLPGYHAYLLQRALQYHGYQVFTSWDRRTEGDGLDQENAYQYRLETFAILSPIDPQLPRGVR